MLEVCVDDGDASQKLKYSLKRTEKQILEVYVDDGDVTQKLKKNSLKIIEIDMLEVYVDDAYTTQKLENLYEENKNIHV